MANIYPILTDPNPILRAKAEELDLAKFTKKGLKALCLDMAETMIKSDGIGLAAPQIGKSIRLIAVNTADGPICLINPKITRKSLRKEWGEEGCLSVPNIFGEVRRHRSLSCRYLDAEAEPHTVKAEGMFARVIQHEIDHLDGILFIDKMRSIKIKK